MTKKIDKLYEALERLANHASYGISSDDHEIMNRENYKKQMKQLSKDVNLICKFIEEKI